MATVSPVLPFDVATSRRLKSWAASSKRSSARRVQATSSQTQSSSNNDTSSSPTAPIGAVRERDSRHYKPTKRDIWLLGLTIVIGGQYFSWNAGLAVGLYSYLAAVLLAAAAYLVLCCCVAEITGALPFAGGAYGLSRCTLGFLPGYLIGCCEALEYIAYVATSVDTFSKMVASLIPGGAPFRPLISLLFYLSALVFHIAGDRVFWHLNTFLAVVSLLLVVVYVFGSLPFVNFAHNADRPEFQSVGGVAGFIKALPLACWFFVGVESLGLASGEVAEPKKTIPRAQISCILTLIVTCLAVFFTTVSLPPGMNAVATELLPFNNGYQLALGISSQMATVLSLPAAYATAFGFMWSYGKIINAMAQSRLLPSVLATTSQRFDTPHVAICFGALLSYLLTLLQHFVPSVSAHVFNVCITAAFMSYTGQCIGYISLKLNYKSVQSSSFYNPFGIPGAVFSMAVWLLGIVSIIGFQGNGGVEALSFLVVIVLLLVFYYTYSQKRQTFSKQENKILLVAHVMKFNTSRSKAKKASTASHKSVSMLHPKQPQTGRHSTASKLSGQRASSHTLVKPFGS